MAEIHDVNPLPPVWPTQPKESIRDRDRRPPRRRPEENRDDSTQDKEDKDRPHIDEYA